MSEYKFPPYLECKGENTGLWVQEVIVDETTDKREFRVIPIYNVPTTCLLDEWEGLLLELSEKEAELVLVKGDYNQQEFDIVYTSDIDFKSLYNSTSEKVRKQHAENELKPLKDKQNDLELGIAWIKNYLPFLREAIRIKKE